jgi:hypothetical protein
MKGFSSSVVIVYQQLSIKELSSDKIEIEGGCGEQDKQLVDALEGVWQN